MTNLVSNQAAIPGYTPPAVAPVDANVKPGYQTTEFWVTTILSLATWLNQSGFLGAHLIPMDTLTVITTPVVAYIASRHFTKK